MIMDTIPTPADIASRLPRNRAVVGDTIVYRDTTTLLIERMLVEGVLHERGGVHKIYEGSGNRLVHSRYVTEVVKA